MGFEVGQRVGDYEIVSVLGAGGMGRVYRVRNIISDRTEAMKVLLPDLTAEPDLAVRFITEIRVLASFDHPNIAQLHTAFQVDNQLVMMMEFVEGFSLEQRARRGPIPQDNVVDYIQQVLSALSYAHSRGVIHRDIKPANIIVTSHGVAKLMDFGIAKSKVENDLTRPGTTMGSLYYMSPEQVRGGTVDARSDIYSVGIMMYELLAGRRPFEADSAYGILNKQLNVPPQPPIEVNPQLPRPLSDLILSALAKDPAQRFQNADAFSNALRHVAARPDNPPLAEQAAFAPVVIPAAAQNQGNRNTPNPERHSSMASQPAAGSHRARWVTLGALAVLAILICTALGLPHFLRTGATAKNSGDSSAQSTSTPAPSGSSVSTPSSGQGATAAVPATTPLPTAVASTGATVTGAAPPQVASDSGSASQPKLGGKAKSPRPEYQPAPPPVPLQQTGGSLQSASAGPTDAEVEQARDEKVALDARASAVSASLENLKRQQEADGLGLRQDIASAYARMNGYLRAADTDLDKGNLTAAHDHMDKADGEVKILEGFFGR